MHASSRFVRRGMASAASPAGFCRRTAPSRRDHSDPPLTSAASSSIAAWLGKPTIRGHTSTTPRHLRRRFFHLEFSERRQSTEGTALSGGMAAQCAPWRVSAQELFLPAHGCRLPARHDQTVPSKLPKREKLISDTLAMMNAGAPSTTSLTRRLRRRCCSVHTAATL